MPTDTERLDWLIARHGNVLISHLGGPTRVEWFSWGDDEWAQISVDGDGRAAIDAAMSREADDAAR